MKLAIRNILSLIIAVLAMQSCSMMTEDMKPCDQVVRLHFKYDYNIQRADMFSDHVGEVRLWVVDDATGKVVKDTVVSNRDNANAISTHPGNQFFCIEMRDLEPEKSYRFVAVAEQRPYDETSVRKEDKFIGTFPAKSENADKLTMKLTRATAEDSEGCHSVDAPACGLDTLWIGHTTKSINIPRTTGQYTINDTISMVRDTKYLTITLRQLEDPTNIYADDFKVEIIDANGFLAWNNDVLADSKLLYTPHAQRTTEVMDKDNNVTARAAHYDISFSRLMYYEGIDAGKNALLRITNVNTGEVAVKDINLPSILSQGRNAFALYNYRPQEYLDREYEYNLDFFLLGGKWQFVDISVNIMAWAIRVQNELL